MFYSLDFNGRYLSEEVAFTSFKLLWEHLTDDQKTQIYRYGEIKEVVHGRLYTMDGRGFAGVRLQDGDRLHAPSFTSPYGGHPDYASSACDEYYRQRLLPLHVVPEPFLGMPRADILLINLLLLRHEPKRFWTVACLAAKAKNQDKGVNVCIDDDCRYCH